ncbi:MAG: hypothetical protein HZC28_13715 [Spirochaetes bacterium]|nr:hypothetical protein [Spirochaetota bacterium]
MTTIDSGVSIIRKMINVAAAAGIALSLNAAAYYVDHMRGDDANDGLSDARAFRTFTKAMKQCAAEAQDTVMIVPSALPYREMFVINGKRYSKDAPLVINGGGNWLVGTEQIPVDEWRLVEGDVYCAPDHFKRQARDNFFLVINGKVQRMGRGRLHQNNPLPGVTELKPDEWTVRGDDLLVRLRPGFSIFEYRIERSTRDNAVAFAGSPSTHVIVSNINMKFVYNDGINIHCTRTGFSPGNGTHDIVLSDIRSDYNFDEGISAHDYCDFEMSNAVMIGNNCGVVHIDWAQCTHRSVLIADSFDIDIMCYGSGADVFEDTYVHSTRAVKNLQWDAGTNTRFVFSNSVFYFDPVNPNTCNIAANASSRLALMNATVIDGSKNPRTIAAVTAKGTVSAENTVIIPASQAGVQVRRGEPLENGAKLSAHMRNVIAGYYSGELTGKGFACVRHSTKPNALRLAFNYPVDVLSLAGIRFFKDGKPYAQASLRLSDDGTSVIADNFAIGTYRIVISDMLLSVRGMSGCEPKTIDGIVMSGEGYTPKADIPEKYSRSESSAVSPPAISLRTSKPGVILMEAESGELAPPMLVENNNAASGGKYIVVPQGTGLEKGSVSYRFEVADSGDYIIWLRIIAVSSDDDSIFVRMDGGTRKLSDLRAAKTFSWDRVRDRIDGNVDIASASTFTLEKGAHTLTLNSREDGLKIDAVALAKSGSGFDPAKDF